jgi:hypothetical protein
MKKRSTTRRERPPARPIALVCVSPHEQAGPQATEPDTLIKVRGKWAWCPSGAASGHEWRGVASGSFNALRTQLVEVSRLVDVALNSPRAGNAATGVVKKASKTANIPKSRGRRR